jgi:predicted DNA-binding transcriptional regulator YafY
MRYQQTLEIHHRFETVLRLIRTGKYSTRDLAETTGVSIPTISRIVAALRDQGHEIRAERTKKGWRYKIEDTAFLGRCFRGSPQRNPS